MNPSEDGQAERVYDEVIDMIRRVTRSGVPDGVIAHVIFAIGVKALLREGITTREVQTRVVEVANLRPERRGEA